MSQWIKISDQRPTPMVPVLATNGKDITIAVWRRDLGTFGDFGVARAGKKKTTISHLPGATHWQSLPALPQPKAAL